MTVLLGKYFLNIKFVSPWTTITSIPHSYDTQHQQVWTQVRLVYLAKWWGKPFQYFKHWQHQSFNFYLGFLSVHNTRKPTLIITTIKLNLFSAACLPGIIIIIVMKTCIEHISTLLGIQGPGWRSRMTLLLQKQELCYTQRKAEAKAMISKIDMFWDLGGTLFQRDDPACETKRYKIEWTSRHRSNQFLEFLPLWQLSPPLPHHFPRCWIPPRCGVLSSYSSWHLVHDYYPN